MSASVGTFSPDQLSASVHLPDSGPVQVSVHSAPNAAAGSESAIQSRPTSDERQIAVRLPGRLPCACKMDPHRPKDFSIDQGIHTGSRAARGRIVAPVF